MIDRQPHDRYERGRRLLQLGGLALLGVVLFGLGLLLGRLTADDGDDDGTAANAALAAPTATIAVVAPTPTTAPPPPTATVAATPPPPSQAPAVAADGAPIVCLDPGHGGEDLGNVRLEDGQIVVQEKDLVLDVGLALEERLTARGMEVVMTRREDVRVNAENADVNGDGEVGEETTTQRDDLQKRIKICNAAGADLLVSIHFNGAENLNLNGYEVWYTAGREFGDRSARFAQIMHDELGARMAEAGYEAFSRGWADDTDEETGLNYALTGPALPGIYPEPSQMPGAIVEALFLSYDDDWAFLQTEAALPAIITAYENAIVRYFEEFPA